MCLEENLYNEISRRKKMYSGEEFGKKKGGRASLIAMIIIAVIFTTALFFYVSIMYEMLGLALIPDKDLGEGLGLALLLVIELIVAGAMIALYLISLIPFFISRGDSSVSSVNGIIKEKCKRICKGIFVYQTIAIVLSIIAFIVLIALL